VDVNKLENIKKLAVIAMFSDDVLMEMLVLKGGNALDIIYGIAPRASLDLDFSISTEFNPNEIDSIKSKIKTVLSRTFDEHGYKAFDIRFGERPEDADPRIPQFWGGYRVEFKIIEKGKYKQRMDNMRYLRLNAIDVGPGSQKTYKIEISKWEYCKFKQEAEIDDYTVYVYTPEMIVIEKLRAICQQMPEYAEFIGTSYRTARARDFFDIYTVVKHFKIDLTTNENIQLLKDIFAIKHVSLELLGQVSDYREYHRPDFTAVENTLKPEARLKDFDFYFDYVVNKCGDLTKTLGEV
jgi:predicted nucleotidyltransferase component of viral defense system